MNTDGSPTRNPPVLSLNQERNGKAEQAEEIPADVVDALFEQGVSRQFPNSGFEVARALDGHGARLHLTRARFEDGSAYLQASTEDYAASFRLAPEESKYRQVSRTQLSLEEL